jgi:hypothetical protein
MASPCSLFHHPRSEVTEGKLQARWGFKLMACLGQKIGYDPLAGIGPRFERADQPHFCR